MAGLAQSIMSMFSPAGGAKMDPPAGSQVPPNNPSQVASPGNPLPGAVPGNPTVPLSTATDPNAVVNPLDILKDLWKAPEGVTPEPTVADIFKNLNVEKLNESASKLDFRGVATPEMLARVKAGGDDGLQATLEIMNAMNQRAYAQSTLAGIRVTEQAMNRADKITSDRIPGMVRTAATADSLRAEDAMYNHPAMQPLVGALQSAFQGKNPNATVSEIKSQVVDALKAYGQVLNPPKSDTGTTGSGKAKEEDWSLFLDS